jgi:hypothetical protein
MDMVDGPVSLSALLHIHIITGPAFWYIKSTQQAVLLRYSHNGCRFIQTRVVGVRQYPSTFSPQSLASRVGANGNLRRSAPSRHLNRLWRAEILGQWLRRLLQVDTPLHRFPVSLVAPVCAMLFCETRDEKHTPLDEQSTPYHKPRPGWTTPLVLLPLLDEQSALFFYGFSSKARTRLILVFPKCPSIRVDLTRGAPSISSRLPWVCHNTVKYAAKVEKKKKSLPWMSHLSLFNVPKTKKN